MATPDINYSFAYWVLDGQNIMQNPITVEMNNNHTLQAIFNQMPIEPPQMTSGDWELFWIWLRTQGNKHWMEMLDENILEWKLNNGF